ncbi:lipoprotein intramolecular transacylase Lit [Cellvibrio sp. ARAG 10.3]|uniref:lipoprotein intramolecular transacylase Lit n=1 Tax=Cellvibrio sp. ARAG 10.3 TaxID=3451358 RepID=UPI003F486107
MNNIRNFLLWPLLLLGHLLAVSLLAWHLLAQVNFAYPLGYKVLDVEQHIRHFGPLNRYKKEFEQTTKAEHLDLFAQITRAVQNHGEGLADIRYRLPNGTSTPLMREAEVIHLQDVANLIDVLYWAGLIGGLAWLCLLAYAYRQRIPFPALKKILLGFVSGLMLITLSILLIGPKAVFYWLHEQIFPDEHEWFFFYQDSLMTTLMKAPDLFGFIAVILVVVIMVLWGLSVWGMTRLLKSAVMGEPAVVARPSNKKLKKK